MKKLNLLIPLLLYGAVILAQSNADVKATVHVNEVKHAITSHIIGTNRNTVKFDEIGPGQFNQDYAPFTFQQMIQQYADVKPRFGTGRKLHRMGHGPTDGKFDGDPTCNANPAITYDGFRYGTNYGTGPYPYDSIGYFIEEADQLGADMIVNINVGSGTKEEAKALVQYLKTNGLLNKVAFFEMGNELGGFWQRGHHYLDQRACTPQQYVETVEPFIDAMKSVEPTIKIAACGAYNNSWDWPGCSTVMNSNPCATSATQNYESIVTAIVSGIGKKIDFIAYHGHTMYEVIQKDNYSCKISLNESAVADITKRASTLLATADYAKRNRHRKVISLIDALRGQYDIENEIRLVDTEISTEIEAPEEFFHTMTQGLYTGDHMLTAIQENYGATITFCLFHWQDSDPANGIIGQDKESNAFFSLDGQKLKPMFFIHQLIAENLGDTVLVNEDLIGDALAMNLKACNTFDDIELNKIDLVATKATDGSIRTLIINRSPETLILDLDFIGGQNYQSHELKSVSGGNDYLKSEVGIISTQESVNAISIPGLSVNVLISQTATPCAESSIYTSCGITLKVTGLQVELIDATNPQIQVAIGPPWDDLLILCNNWNGPACTPGANGTLPYSGAFTVFVTDGSAQPCTFKIEASLTGPSVDNDMDRVPCSLDCDDNDPAVGAKQAPGTACDDENPATSNDVIQADGCTCMGESCSSYVVGSCEVTLKITGLNVSFEDGPMGQYNIQLYQVTPSGWQGPYILCNNWNVSNPCIANANVNLPVAGNYVILINGLEACNQISVDVIPCARNNNASGSAREGVTSTPASDMPSSMLIYPNPALNDFNVEFNTNTTGTLTLYNLEGKSLSSIIIDDQQKVLSISTEGLNDGVYIIEFNGRNSSLNQKLIILHR